MAVSTFSIFREPELVVSTEENSKKKKKKKKKTKPKDTNDAESVNIATVEDAQDVDPNTDEITEQTGAADVLSEQKVSKKKVNRRNTDASEDNVICSSVDNGSSGIELVNKSVEENEIKNVVKEKKKFKNKGTAENVNSHLEVTGNKIVEKAKSELSKRQKKNLRKKIKKTGMVVQSVNNVKPSRNSQNTSGKKRKISDNTQVPIKKQKTELEKDGKERHRSNEEQKNKGTLNKEEQKNKETSKEKQKNKGALNKDIKNKDKFKNKNKQNNDRFKNKIKQVIDKNKSNDSSDNPMNNLSDERLKAYGLNPKKYRSFLKYKKF